MLFLVRHAQSPFSKDEMRPLSPAGHAAAMRVADLLVDAGVTRVVSSPYTRAVQTVQPLADRLGLPVDIEPDLRERRLCDEIVDDVQHRIERVWTDFTFAFPNGESSATAQDRVRRAVDRIAREAGGRPVALSSHGNALALFLRTLDPDVDFGFWSRMSKPDVYAVGEGADGRPFRRLWTP